MRSIRCCDPDGAPHPRWRPILRCHNRRRIRKYWQFLTWNNPSSGVDAPSRTSGHKSTFGSVVRKQHFAPSLSAQLFQPIIQEGGCGGGKGWRTSFIVRTQRSDVDVCHPQRSAEQTSELQSLMRISYAAFCLKKKKHTHK